MDKKLAKILYTINQNKDSTKLDIKNKTGFSMTTVLNGVKRLEDYGLITCGTRNVKGGKAPSVINTSMCAYVLGLGYSNGYIRATRVDLNGNVECLSENRLEESEENYDSVISEIKKDYPPVAVGIIGKSNKVTFDFNSRRKVQKVDGDICEGLSSFYRFYSLKNNSETIVVYVDEDIKIMRSDETDDYLDVNELHSPIIHKTLGRLTYRQVLSKSQVARRLAEKYGATIGDLDSVDERLVAYRNRLNVAFRELICTVDKLLKPKCIIVGGYLPERAVDISGLAVSSKYFYAGNSSDAVGHLAGAIALNSLYYYD